jgi:hypothetical protein
MTDGGAAFQPGTEDVRVPFRPRGSYAGYRAFGGGDGAVLVKPEVARELRSAAEFATQERRFAGGLLYGRGWADEQGAYLVIDGYLEAGPGENSGDRIYSDGSDRFTLSEADLRLLREDAARMYSASLEAGWWRTLPALGDFGPQDFVTQAELVGPDGVGLLVYGSGIHWGTAYLGPDGHAADSAGTLVTVPAPAPWPSPGAGSEAGRAPEPVVVDLAAGETLAQEPLPADAAAAEAAPPRRRVRRSAAAPVRTVTRRWVSRPARPDYPGPETPADVQFVVGALIAVTIAVAIIVGVLVSNVIVAVIIAVIGIVAILSSIRMSRR